MARSGLPAGGGAGAVLVQDPGTVTQVFDSYLTKSTFVFLVFFLTYVLFHQKNGSISE